MLYIYVMAGQYKDSNEDLIAAILSHTMQNLPEKLEAEFVFKLYQSLLKLDRKNVEWFNHIQHLIRDTCSFLGPDDLNEVFSFYSELES